MALGNVHLTPQLVQAVRDAVDILAVAGEHTRLARRGKRYVGLCPLHKEKTPSFSVEPVQGLFYCFGCGVGGDAIKLHMLLSGDDFPAAIEALALRHGIPLPARPKRAAGGAAEPDVQGALEAAAAFFRRALEAAEAPRRYLAERRIPPELVESFGLGYAPPGWRDLLGALRREVAVADLVAAGLAVAKEGGGEPYDRFRHRLMFPIHAASGRLLGFGGRTLGDDKAKYINTAETAGFHKGRLLYGLSRAKLALREAGKALLVEGYFDVIGAVASGVEWTVASMGTALTPEQAGLLARYADEVVVGYDGDEAGETAFRRALPLLLSEGRAVRRARFGTGQDPDSLRLAEGPESVARAVEEAEDAVELFFSERIPEGGERNPNAQSRIAREVFELLRQVADPVAREHYGRRAAQRLRINERVFWDLVRSPQKQQPSRRGEQGVPARDSSGGAGGQDLGASAPQLVRSLEERVLADLLSGVADLPLPDKLPRAKVFSDPVNRNIYEAFCVLYSRGDCAPPQPREVLAELGNERCAVDQMARILVDNPSASTQPGLLVLLDQLQRRWWKQRQQELRAELGEAQRAGDGERLERLLREQQALSRNLYRRPERDPGGGSS